MEIYIGVGRLIQMVILFFTFLGTARLFSNLAVPFHVPTSITALFLQILLLLKNDGIP